jgi:hypothetical protein
MGTVGALTALSLVKMDQFPKIELVTLYKLDMADQYTHRRREDFEGAKSIGAEGSGCMMKQRARYVNGGTVAKNVAPGRVLCHNHVRHVPDTPCGVNGFRAWTDIEPPKDFVMCPCGYAGLPHYALHEQVTAGMAEGWSR